MKPIFLLLLLATTQSLFAQQTHKPNIILILADDLGYGKWKGVRLNVGKNPDPPVELYDLEKDPGKQQNVAPQHPDIVRKIKQYMQEAHQPNTDGPLLANETNGQGAAQGAHR